MVEFATVQQALDAMREGKPVLVLDDEGRENEGDAILAGETITTEWMGWLIRHSSGYICAPLPGPRADELGLPMMVARNQESNKTAYTITCDAARGVTTGISAHDRALTVRTLADPEALSTDLTRPGHIAPLRARPGGVLERPGHTEACVDLCRLAGLSPVGAICELVHDDGSMLRTPDVLALGAAAGLPVITIEALATWRNRHDRVDRVATTTLPTEYGTLTAIGYRDRISHDEHLALISDKGLAADDGGAPRIRVHSECLTGDVVGSLRCDCGRQLAAALTDVSEHGGAVIYLRGQEGRGVGLAAKLAAYHLQDDGFDTVDAQTELGLPVDAREYGAAAAILTDLGVEELRLLTNNPAKIHDLERNGLHVTDVVPVITELNHYNARYLATKRDRMGHHLPAFTHQEL